MSISDKLSKLIKELDQDSVERIVASMNKLPPEAADPEDPTRVVMRMVGDKWSNLIFFILSAGTIRFSPLLRVINICAQEGAAISKTVLSEKLRIMEKNGLLSRSVSDDIPPKVDYTLTETGLELAGRLVEMLNWVDAHRQEIEHSRKHFSS